MLAQLMKGCLVNESEFELAVARSCWGGRSIVAGGVAAEDDAALRGPGVAPERLTTSENFADPLCGVLAAAKEEEEEEEEDADEFEDDDEDEEDEEFDGDDEFEDDDDELFDGDDEDEEFDDDMDDEDEEDEDF